jgi:hypothetical protein
MQPAAAHPVLDAVVPEAEGEELLARDQAVLTRREVRDAPVSMSRVAFPAHQAE